MAVPCVVVLAAVGAVKLTFSVCEVRSSRSKSARRTYSEFNASRDRGQVIHLFSEEAKQLLHPVTGLREAVCSM